ncbi:Leukotoxin [Shimia sp. SK013]|uniref:Hint domain-containing protein n=1 Tax=Shimia sp. SK013 TaxID=1389006 RepID=UPI0006B6395F|nr:Hint domain-containing protein [Shimia sp. SK013]KPA19922.1 Leukotoxin [Shimia sp. SK013]
MPTTFDVISLGVLPTLDPTEGNSTAENASVLVGQTMGGADTPLYDQVQTFSQHNSSAPRYLTDNTQANDQFTIDGGAPQTYDALVAYNATITYADGTTADISAVVVQSTTGETYLVPEMSANADHSAMQGGAIESITLNSVATDAADLAADRMDVDFMEPDGEFDGTAGDDVIQLGSFDSEGDLITGSADSVVAGLGDDTIEGAGGGDTIEGGTGNDVISGNDGDDSLLGGRGDDVISGGSGNDTIDAGAGHDSVDAGEGDDLILGDSASETVGTGTIQTEWSALHMGSADDMDLLVDGASVALGTYGGAGDPLGSNQVRVQVDDADNDGVADSDNQGNPETVNIDGTPQTLDAVAVFNAELTFEDGTTEMITAVVFQTESGDIFLAPEMSFNADAEVMVSQPIQSIELISVEMDSNSVDLAANRVDFTFEDGEEAGDDFISAGEGNDTVIGGAGDDTIQGEAGNDSLSGGDGDDFLFGGDGDDVFVVSEGHDTIKDFNAGNSGALGDGDTTNNDFVDLSGHYDNLSEMNADLDDDGILNQSNVVDTHGRAVDYSDNSQFGDGSLTFFGDAQLTTDNTGVVCFTTGTGILTPEGERAVEDLRAGDVVCTADNGPQPIVWIGSTTLSHAELLANPKLMPVFVSAQTLGSERSLLVSPQHGLILPGTDDTLVRATHLNRFMPGSRVARGKRGVTYVHMMFEDHQIVFSNGYPSESLFPGPMALQAMAPDTSAEIEALFPGLLGCDSRLATVSVYGKTARDFRVA